MDGPTAGILGVLISSAVAQWIFIAVLLFSSRSGENRGASPSLSPFRHHSKPKRKPVSISEAQEWQKEQDQ